MNRRQLIGSLAAPSLLAAYGAAARAQTEDVSLALSGSAAENTVRLQAAIATGYGKRINVLGTADFLGVGIEPRQGGPGVQIVGRGSGADGRSGTVLRNVGSGNAITILNRSGKPYDGPITIKDLGLRGTPKSGNGIEAEEINGQFVLEGLFLDGHGKTNVLATRCFGMMVRDCFSNHPGGDGVAIIDAGNNLVLEHLRSFGSKTVNLRISGKQTAFAPVLIAPDVSYGQVGLLIENAGGVSITGFYCEDCPTAARLAPGTSASIQGGFVLRGVFEARGVGAISGMRFQGKGGLVASPGMVVSGCQYVSGATFRRG